MMSRSFWAYLLRRAVLPALIVVAIGAAGGFTLNHLRTDPLPLDLPGHLLLTESGARGVFLGEARRMFDEAEYIFVDVRGTEAFLEEHIEGALSLPLTRFQELYPELQVWSAGQPVLVYGSKGNFLEVDDLARRLRDRGEEEVTFLIPGFEGWTDKGFPVESGSDGLLDPAAWED